MTEDELKRGIVNFAATISNQPLGLALYRPVAGSKHTNCIANATAAMKKWGGSVCYGWYFLHKISPEFGDYLTAIHHAVWHNPDNLSLIDVTPYHPEEKHKPLSPGGDVLFLVDDKAKPISKENMIFPLPSCFYPLSSDKKLIGYMEKLQHDEYEFFNKQYGIVFKHLGIDT